MKRILCYPLVFASLSAGAAPDTFRESFETSDHKTFQLVIQQSPARVGAADFIRFGHWGAAGAVNSACISELKISRNGLKVQVASKHYVDLCNVNRLTFSERAPYVVVTLYGGDASDSFSAEYIIHGVNLVERVVRHGEFPEVYERTKFNYPLVVQ